MDVTYNSFFIVFSKMYSKNKAISKRHVTRDSTIASQSETHQHMHKRHNGERLFYKLFV